MPKEIRDKKLNELTVTYKGEVYPANERALAMLKFMRDFLLSVLEIKAQLAKGADVSYIWDHLGEKERELVQDVMEREAMLWYRPNNSPITMNLQDLEVLIVKVATQIRMVYKEYFEGV